MLVSQVSIGLSSPVNRCRRASAAQDYAVPGTMGQLQRRVATAPALGVAQHCWGLTCASLQPPNRTPFPGPPRPSPHSPWWIIPFSNKAWPKFTPSSVLLISPISRSQVTNSLPGTRDTVERNSPGLGTQRPAWDQLGPTHSCEGALERPTGKQGLGAHSPGGCAETLCFSLGPVAEGWV